MAQEGEDALKSLPLLQARIRKDPQAYDEEFSLQLDHFKSALDLLVATPQKPERSFHELVMFVAYSVPFYPKQVEQFKNALTSNLVGLSNVLHPLSRRTLVNALLLLRTKKVVTLLEILPLLFDLIDIPDKSLRELLIGFIVKDISRNKFYKGKTCTELQLFILAQLNQKSDSRQKRALKIAIDLYRSLTFSVRPQKKHMKVTSLATNFLIGNFCPLLDDDDDDNSDEDQKRAPIGSKNTRGKTRKLAREIETQKRKIERRTNRKQIVATYSGGSILDAVRDPQRLADRLLGRVASNSQKNKDSFSLRLALMNCVSRLIGRFDLVVLNFYPLIQRFLNPKQNQVTKILAILAQGCHELVPPDDLLPVMKTIMEQFVVDHQTPEVIVVGLNVIREVCTRAPLALTEEMLADLAEFRKFRHKVVVSGARSVINLYRDIYPGLLHRKLRGKAAAIEVAENQAPKPAYGQREVVSNIPGLDLLNQSDDDDDGKEDDDDDDDDDDDGKEDDDNDGEDDYEDDGEDDDAEPTDEEQIEQGPYAVSEDEAQTGTQEPEVTAVSRKRARLDVTEDFLTEKHFKILKRLRQGNGASASSNEDESDEEAESIDQGVIDPELLKSGVKKKGKAYRISLVQAGKVDKPTLQWREAGKQLKASLPESVKRRNKPLLMVKRKRQIWDKRHTDAGTKMSSIRKHMKTLKKCTGKKRRYRRM